jgi:hypothetical protein
MSFQRAGAGLVAGQIADGATLQGAGTFTMPDGTVQRPGVHVITPQDIGLASDVINLQGSKAATVLAKLTNTTGVTITLTGAPSIDAGQFDGQKLALYIDKDTLGGITLSDESGVPGSRFRMDAATKAFNARDIGEFTWHSDSAAWIQDYQRLNVL